MAIVPRKKISQNKGRTRHSTWETLNIKRLVNLTSLVKCKNCGASKLSHRVCPTCGFYGDKQVITVKAKGKKPQVVDA